MTSVVVDLELRDPSFCAGCRFYTPRATSMPECSLHLTKKGFPMRIRGFAYSEILDGFAARRLPVCVDKTLLSRKP